MKIGLLVLLGVFSLATANASSIVASLDPATPPAGTNLFAGGVNQTVMLVRFTQTDPTQNDAIASLGFWGLGSSPAKSSVWQGATKLAECSPVVPGAEYCQLGGFNVTPIYGGWITLTFRVDLPFSAPSGTLTPYMDNSYTALNNVISGQINYVIGNELKVASTPEPSTFAFVGVMLVVGLLRRLGVI